MLMSLWLPIVLSTVALFFSSFLSWMVLGFHKQDWTRLDDEDGFLRSASGIKPGNYMFPHCQDQKEMESEEVKQKMEQGPVGVITVFPGINMGRNLGLTVLYFLCCSTTLAYLATMALESGASFLDVFRFFATAGLLTFLGAIVYHSIWFRCRLIGHVLESICYAAIAGAIFGFLWPTAV